jgi:uncharacterized protein DUF6152
VRTFQNRLCAIAVGGALSSYPALAHHSFAAEFDHNKPVTLEGTVTKVEWQNPHTRIYLDVADSLGAVVAWELELGSPNGLIRAGWSRHTLQGGEKISVKGFLAKDGSHLANASSIYQDGKLILSETTPGGQDAAAK